MNFVVLDLEWNQAMSSKSEVFNHLPIHLRGEIIEIGAVKLEGIGMKEEAAIIRCHHRKKTENDPPELALLRAADELN